MDGYRFCILRTLTLKVLHPMSLWMVVEESNAVKLTYEGLRQMKQPFLVPKRDEKEVRTNLWYSSRCTTMYPLSCHGVHDGPLEDEQSLVDTITGLDDDLLTENAESVISDP